MGSAGSVETVRTGDEHSCKFCDREFPTLWEALEHARSRTCTLESLKYDRENLCREVQRLAPLCDSLQDEVKALRAHLERRGDVVGSWQQEALRLRAEVERLQGELQAANEDNRQQSNEIARLREQGASDACAARLAQEAEARGWSMTANEIRMLAMKAWRDEKRAHDFNEDRDGDPCRYCRLPKAVARERPCV